MVSEHFVGGREGETDGESAGKWVRLGGHEKVISSPSKYAW